MADFVESFGASMAVRDGDTDSLVRAINYIFDQQDVFRQRARKSMPAARAAHSNASFVTALWEARSSLPAVTR